jgi:hypothetical protein
VSKEAKSTGTKSAIFVFDTDGLFDIQGTDKNADLSGGISVSIGNPSEQGSGLFCSNDKNCS